MVERVSKYPRRKAGGGPLSTRHVYADVSSRSLFLPFCCPHFFHFVLLFVLFFFFGQKGNDDRRFSSLVKFAPPETNPVAGSVGILFSSFFSRRKMRGEEGEREVRGSWIADRRRLCSTEYSERVRTRRVLVERLRLSLRNDPLLLAGLKLHLPTTRLFYDSSLRIYVRENRRSSTTYVIILMRSCLRDNR